MNELDLAALLVSRVCHDLISPVGALANGVEVLADENDPSMREHAIALISKSAEQAAAKLKLCRLAFGSMGSAGDHVSLGDAKDALDGLLKDSKTKLDWRAPPMILGKDTVKLALNLALAAMDSIPRGGVLKLSADDRADGTTISVCAEGPMPRLTEDLQAALSGETPFADLDGRRVQPFLTGMIARSLGTSVTHSLDAVAATLSVNVPKQAAEQVAA